MKRHVALLLALFLVLVAFVPAAADGPLVWDDEDYDFARMLVDCRPFGFRFRVWDRSVGHYSDVLYFDDEGKVAKIIFKDSGVDYVYSADNPADVVSGAYAYSIHRTITEYDRDGDPATAICHRTGTYWNIQLPGHGVVYHEGGQIADLQSLGKVDWKVLAEIKQVGLSETDEQALCEYFAD